MALPRHVTAPSKRMWSYALYKSLYTLILNRFWKDFSKWIVILPQDDSIDFGSFNPMDGD